MAPSLDDVGELASLSVLGSLRQRYEGLEFYRDLWWSMGDAGLFGMTVPEEYGGSGGGTRALGQAVSRFAHDGCDMGLTLSWITHLSLCIKSIELFGTRKQKRAYLPKLVSGEWVGAAAVSEPGTGAHPAGIETKAEKKDGGFVLNGKKLYITDGSVADLLVVVAATGESEGGMKELTAFLVETGAPGFSSSRMDLNFLKTSPHAELTFTDMQLADSAVLGAPGEGHSMASRSAFARERSLVLAAGVGLFTAAAQSCGERLVKKHGSFDLEGKEASSWIHHMSALEAYESLSSGLLEAAFDDLERWRKSIDLLIYLGISYAKWGIWLGDFVVKNQIEPSFPLDIILNDMKLVLIGEGMLFKEGRKRYIQPYEA